MIVVNLSSGAWIWISRAILHLLDCYHVPDICYLTTVSVSGLGTKNIYTFYKCVCIYSLNIHLYIQYIYCHNY